MENRDIIRSAGVVGGFTMCSRFLGLVRDVLMAGLFGASLAMDAFVVAFTIPNLFRRLFGEGALSSAFIPVFVEARRRAGDADAWRLARTIITMVTLVLLGVVVIGLLLATCLYAQPDVLARFADRLGRPHLAGMLALVLPLLRIMLPYMLFICLAALSMGILNSFHHFALPAATPAFLNVLWILSALFVCPLLGDDPNVQIYAIAWTIFVAGIVQLGLQLPILYRHGYRPGFALAVRDERVGRVVRLMGPAALGLAVTQINVVIDRILAASIGEGAVAALFYSERMIYFPLGIFGTAIGTVLLPVLSGHAADDETAKAREAISHSLRTLLFLMVPASVGLLVLAHPVIQMIFEWRHFSAANTAYTSIALRFYAPGLVVFSLAKIFVPAFYAKQDTKTPVRIGVCTVLLNLVLNVTFVLTWPQHLKHAGLACATVISEGAYALVLGLLLHRRMGSLGWGRVAGSALRVLVAALVMGAFAAYAVEPVYGMVSATGLPAKVSQVVTVFSLIAASVALYLATARLLRCPELGELWSTIKQRKRADSRSGHSAP